MLPVDRDFLSIEGGAHEQCCLSGLAVFLAHCIAQLGCAHWQCCFQGCRLAVLLNCMHACTAPACPRSIHSRAGLA